MKGRVYHATLKSPGVAGTGLLDLNGHDIRSGDKVKVKGNSSTWTVVLGQEVKPRRRQSVWTVTEKVTG